MTRRNIKHRQAAIMAEFPSSLMHNPSDITNPKARSELVFTKLLLKMESLLNDFFVDRLLLKKGHASQAATSLLVTSFDLVSNTLVLWTNFERFAKLKRDFEWILMAYGAPAGGILCKELQKPSFRGKHPDDVRITRSAIIQRLSLLVGFLDWVDPLAPNANLCNDCKSVIQLVLDQALNDGPSSLTATTATTSTAAATAAEFVGDGDRGIMGSQLEYEFPTGLDFSFELLDSFDWLSAVEQ
jgi:hypothetical protein